MEFTTREDVHQLYNQICINRWDILEASGRH